jgi:cytochrome P450
VITCFILDTATALLFGESVESQRAYIHRTHKKKGIAVQAWDDKSADMGLEEMAFINDFAEAHEVCSYYMVLRFGLQRLAFLANDRHLKKAVKTLRSLPKRIIKEAKETGRWKTKRKFDLLTALMEQTQDEKELEDQTLGMLFGALSTTSTLLLWSIMLLAQIPDIWTKLRDAVLHRFPPPHEQAEGTTLDPSALKECKYLQDVLRESLRLYQPAALESRVALRDTILPTGGGADGTSPIAVQKGQVVLWCSYAMHRRQDLWGADVLSFKPERSEVPETSRLLGGGWLYQPFGGGPRTCLGQQYALTEASYFLVRFLQRLEGVELDPESAAGKGERVGKTLGATLTPVEVRVRFREGRG